MPSEGRLAPFLLEGGRVGDGGVATTSGWRAPLGVGANLRACRGVSGHTTTQPSSLEEEGYGDAKPLNIAAGWVQCAGPREARP